MTDMHGSRQVILLAAASLALAGLAGCSSSGGPDYKTAGAVTKPLDIPPDLITPSTSDRYTIPQPGSSTTLSEFERSRRTGGATADSLVAREYENITLERDGQVRWLKVENAAPEQIWSSVRQFWQDSGFVIRTEIPEAGLMQTDWAEKREKINQGAVRNVLGRVFGSSNTSSERDAFRSRIERVQDGSEIYISHRGMVEVVASSVDGNTRWEPRPIDTDLEVEFLRRLMIHLGVSDAVSNEAVQRASQNESSLAELSVIEGNNVLLIREPFDRAWRRVGLALDRSGFTVEDRNRSQGTYFVRYIDVDEVREKPGFFARMFGAEDEKDAQKYRIVVSEGSPDASQVSVSPGEEEAAPVAASDTARRMLGLIQDKLGQ